MNNWMLYEKREYTKHSNSAENYVQVKKIGHQIPPHWDSDYSSGS
jgi:hypothetical protein